MDIWGEGRIQSRDGIVTGFEDGWNINHAEQIVSNGPDTGDDIPNQLDIYDYADPQFPIADNVFSYITLMEYLSRCRALLINPRSPGLINKAKWVVIKAVVWCLIYCYELSNTRNLCNNVCESKGLTNKLLLFATIMDGSAAPVYPEAI